MMYKVSPRRKNNPRQVGGRNNTTRTRNDNDTINRALDQNSQHVKQRFFPQ